MDEIDSQEFPIVEEEKSVFGKLIFWIILVFFIAGGIFAYFYFSNNNEDMFSGKVIVDCEKIGINFNLISCNYSKPSFYNVQVKFVREDTNDISIQEAFVYVISKNNKINYNKVSSEKGLNEQNVNFSKIYSEPLSFYVSIKLNDSFSCLTPQIQCTAILNNIIQNNINNTAPFANAGIDRIVNESDIVTLNGSASYDDEGDSLLYYWTQISGIHTPLSNRYLAEPTFTAPQVSITTNLTFRLVVNDGKLNSLPDNVTITIVNKIDPGSGTIPPPPPLPS